MGKYVDSFLNKNEEKRNMRSIIMFFRKWAILLPLLFFLPFSVYGEEVEEILYVGSPYPPWRIIEDGNIRGINTEILEAILSRHNIRMKFLVAPWKRCLREMKSGNADIMTGVLRKKDREKYMYFIEPPYKTKSNTAVYVREGQELIKKYEDIYGKRIGVVRGAKHFDRFDADEKIIKEVTTTNDLNFEKLSRGRVDAVVCQEVVGDYIVATKGYEGKIEKCPYKYEKPKNVYFTVSKKSPLMRRIKEIEATAEELARKNEFEKIIADFLNKLKSKVGQVQESGINQKQK